MLGYALGALSKRVFALAETVGLVAGARFADRVGKGIRGAPRDALLADLAPPGRRGEAFGLRQSLDTAGAFIGPLLATVLMLAWASGFRAVFWVAVLPGALAVALVMVAMNLVNSASAYPLGRLADRVDRRLLLGAGLRCWWRRTW